MTTPRDEATALLAEALAVALRGDPTPGYRHTPRSDRDYEALVGRAFDYSPTLAADLAFAIAWRRVERALPSGWVFQCGGTLYEATRSHGAVAHKREWRAVGDPSPFVDIHPDDHRAGYGPTPTAALLALAEALEAMR